MSRNQNNVEVIRDEIIAAAAELRGVALAEQDKPRQEVADWIEEQFIGIADPRLLLEVTRNALTFYQGGMGSFQDVDTGAASHAVNRLRTALTHALDAEVRGS